MNIMLASLRNQIGRQGRQIPDVPNDDIVPTRITITPPAPAPTPDIAGVPMMIAQAMQNQQVMLQEQMRIQMARKNHTDLIPILTA